MPSIGARRVLIVHAHPEPHSFNAAMTRTAAEALRAGGAEVVISDLYALGFDPVSDRRNFVTMANPARLDLQAEEALASREGGFVRELQAEMEKLAWCDLLILQFPLWWLGPPAILKGWIDRVFAIGQAYGGGRWFDGGMMRSKRAMCSVTIGGPEASYSDLGVYGPIEAVLHPLHRGVLGFCGFEVIAPFLVFAPGRMNEEGRRQALSDYSARIERLETAPTLRQPTVAEHGGSIFGPRIPGDR